MFNDIEITRIPFETEGTPWVSDDVRLFRLAQPILGLFGEIAEHVMTSTVTDGNGLPETAVVVVTEGGEPMGLRPVITIVASDIVEAVLTGLGFVDVTAAE